MQVFQRQQIVRDESYYRARMTNSQIEALAYHLRYDRLGPAVVKCLSEGFKFKRHSGYERVVCLKYLGNAWNTERVLRDQRKLDDDLKMFAVQWAFPQAYYASFLQVRAFLGSIGAGESSHSAVVKKFGQLLVSGRYPSEMSWYSDGGLNDIQHAGVGKHDMPSSYYLDFDNDESVQNQIAQFLGSTREKQLKDRRKSMREEFRTAGGRIKQRLTSAEWEKVSGSLGVTSVMSLLYRKRLKANYEDIDTFLASEIDGSLILDGLCSIVHSLAFVHEAYLARTLGKKEFRELIKLRKGSEGAISKRHQLVLDCF